MLPKDCQGFSNTTGEEPRTNPETKLDGPKQPETASSELSVEAQISTYLTHLDALIRRGQQVRELLTADLSNPSVIAATRAWQEDCGVTINQLSGGSKAHWLARSFSEAFLLRSASGSAAEGAPPGEIVQRLIAVLEQAVASLKGIGEGPTLSGKNATFPEAPAPHRFDFIHNLELRPVAEQAYSDGQNAFERGEYGTAMLTYCGILEAIVTDAMENKGLKALLGSGAPAEKISDWSFETRLTVAERAGLIRGGCARLPAIARGYRDDAAGTAAVSERDAKITGQVLRVVMRDLDPGR